MAFSTSHHHHHGGHSHSHSHGHGHSHDNSYLTSTNKADAGVRITRIGLLVNCFMAFGKGLGGYFLNSQSLMADAFHSLTDLVSDILTLATVSWSLKAPTLRFPAGYGKIESLGSLGVSSLLLAGGLGLGWHSCEILYTSFFADAVAAAGVAGGEHAHGHHHHHGGDEHAHSHGISSIFSHSHSHNPVDMGIPSIHAAWIAGGSIIVKEYLYRATMKIATEKKSSVLASNAVHHRIDSLTSIVALTAILGSNIFSNVSWLDPVGGLLVSIMVVRAGWGNTGRALLELADVGIDSEVRGSVKKAALKRLAEDSFASGKIQGREIEVRDVQGIKAGQSYLIEVELGVPEGLSIGQSRPIEDAVREGVGAKVRGIRRVKVKFVAKSDEARDFADEFVAADISPRSSPEPEEHDHDHDHKDHGHSHGHQHGGATNGDVRKRH